MGYNLDIKNARMKSRFSDKWVKLRTLSDTFGEELMPSDFEFFYEKNEMDYDNGRLDGERSYAWEMQRRREKNGVYSSAWDWSTHGSIDPYPGQLNTLATILEVFMLLMGWREPNVILIGSKTPYTPLSPEMKAELRNERKKAEMYSKTAVIIGREKLETGEDVLVYMAKSPREKRKEIPVGLFNAKKNNNPHRDEQDGSVCEDYFDNTMLTLRGAEKTRFNRMLETLLADVPDT